MAGEMVWIDLEMTGLDLNTESIIEIATIITDGELNIIAEGPNLAVKVSEELLANMDEWNTTHHTSSGLVERIRSEGVSLEEAIKQTCDFLEQNIEPGTAPLCGNSIGTDRAFLSAQMPEIEAYCHYRNIDVSSIKLLYEAWYPERERFTKTNQHRG